MVPDLSDQQGQETNPSGPTLLCTHTLPPPSDSPSQEIQANQENALSPPSITREYVKSLVAGTPMEEGRVEALVIEWENRIAKLGYTPQREAELAAREKEISRREEELRVREDSLRKNLDAMDLAQVNERLIGRGILSQPHDVEMWEGHIYVTDTSNKRICIFALDGKHVDTINLSLPATASPRCLAIHTDGTIYVTCFDHYVRAISRNGKILKQFGGRGTGATQFNQPRGIVCMSEDRLLIADQNNHRVCIYQRNGTFVSSHTIGTRSQPYGVAVTNGGNMLVSLVGEDRVVELDTSGKVVRSLGTGMGGGYMEMREPRGICVDGRGNVYIADHTNHRVVVYGWEGLFLGVCGMGLLQAPSAVVRHQSGALFVCDHHQGAVCVL